MELIVGNLIVRMFNPNTNASRNNDVTRKIRRECPCVSVLHNGKSVIQAFFVSCQRDGIQYHILDGEGLRRSRPNVGLHMFRMIYELVLAN